MVWMARTLELTKYEVSQPTGTKCLEGLWAGAPIRVSIFPFWWTILTLFPSLMYTLRSTLTAIPLGNASLAWLAGPPSPHLKIFSWLVIIFYFISWLTCPLSQAHISLQFQPPLHSYWRDHPHCPASIFSRPKNRFSTIKLSCFWQLSTMQIAVESRNISRKTVKLSLGCISKCLLKILQFSVLVHLVPLTVCHINAVVRWRNGDLVQKRALDWTETGK